MCLLWVLARYKVAVPWAMQVAHTAWEGFLEEGCPSRDSLVKMLSAGVNIGSRGQESLRPVCEKVGVEYGILSVW